MQANHLLESVYVFPRKVWDYPTVLVNGIINLDIITPLAFLVRQITGKWSWLSHYFLMVLQNMFFLLWWYFSARLVLGDPCWAQAALTGKESRGWHSIRSLYFLFFPGEPAPASVYCFSGSQLELVDVEIPENIFTLSNLLRLYITLVRTQPRSSLNGLKLAFICVQNPMSFLRSSSKLSETLGNGEHAGYWQEWGSQGCDHQQPHFSLLWDKRRSSSYADMVQRRPSSGLEW